ncbi:alpha/beta fold hydrolase (plasmid) [Streptomyces sp. NBC_01387]|uniref:alpha/beta hydrolase n=1 Tax=unclassified Streptomyces TaxID=2593676 RepID=UPI00202433E0|nr:MULTISPECIES: alpha/beta fold hydrolase [unclassified Streptomyces]MCX4554476.1 alpha/beta fold hydrolase [Streptomyces sp. NBC_01500]
MNPNGDVRVEGVALPSEGVDLVGDLYRPASQPAGDASPAVVVVGSWTTVKEQMAGRYAAGLAARGLTTLAFDFRGYGGSKGDPQDFESPERKIADIVSAVDYLKSRPDVDSSRIGALGICAGSGYVAVAASRNPEIRSVAMVAPWLHDRTLVPDIYGGPEGVRERMALGEAARDKYESTGEVDYIPAASDTDERAAMYGPFDYYLYADRGAVPEWRNRFAVMSWPQWLTFDPISVAAQCTAPTFMLHSPDAAIPDGARRFHDGLRAPKELQWTTGSQFDFYDQESTVMSALDSVEAHFGRTL